MTELRKARVQTGESHKRVLKRDGRVVAVFGPGGTAEAELTPAEFDELNAARRDYRGDTLMKGHVATWID